MLPFADNILASTVQVFCGAHRASLFFLNKNLVFLLGWTSANSPDEEQLKALGDEMSADIFAVDGKTYTSQKSIQLYLTTGTASDWFYSDNANVNNEYRAAGYTIELRDTGEYGFELPPDQVGWSVFHEL